jgi:glycosyltransferase involved in cell wall biosynthesis
MAPDTFLIVTAYNEADRIAATFEALAGAFPGGQLLVADDGSTDATAAIAAARGAEVIGTGRMLGKGEAATRGARAALARAGAGGVERQAVFVLCDGDLGPSAAKLVALRDAVSRGEADVAVAAFARRVGGGLGLALGFARWSIRRRCGLRTGAPISGQRALSAQALADALPFAHGFGMEVGMTIDVVRAGHRLVEIELELEHRASGRTPAGFAHRAGQLLDFARAYLARGAPARGLRAGAGDDMRRRGETRGRG